MGLPHLMSHPLYLILSLVPALLSAVVLAFSFHPRVYERFRRWRLPMTVLAYIGTRVGLYVVIYIALGHTVYDTKWFQW